MRHTNEHTVQPGSCTHVRARQHQHLQASGDLTAQMLHTGVANKQSLFRLEISFLEYEVGRIGTGWRCRPHATSSIGIVYS